MNEKWTLGWSMSPEATHIQICHAKESKESLGSSSSIILPSRQNESTQATKKRNNLITNVVITM